jgi:hypothetical protein
MSVEVAVVEVEVVALVVIVEDDGRTGVLNVLLTVAVVVV